MKICSRMLEILSVERKIDTGKLTGALLQLFISNNPPKGNSIMWKTDWLWKKCEGQQYLKIFSFLYQRFTEYKWYHKKNANSMQSNMCKCRRQQEFWSRDLHIWQLKIYVKLYLCWSQHYTMKAYGGMEIQHCALTNLALDGIKWWTSHPSHCTSWPRARTSLAPDLNWNTIPFRPAHNIISKFTTPSQLPLYMAVNVLMDEEWPCLQGHLSQHWRPPPLLHHKSENHPSSLAHCSVTNSGYLREFCLLDVLRALLNLPQHVQWHGISVLNCFSNATFPPPSSPQHEKYSNPTPINYGLGNIPNMAAQIFCGLVSSGYNCIAFCTCSSGKMDARW